jgi:hypothetical protein
MADVMAHPGVFDRAGLLVNWPPGTAGLPFIWSSDDFDPVVFRARLSGHEGNKTALTI